MCFLSVISLLPFGILIFFGLFFPEFPPSTPSPETVRHTESASTMRGSASDGDSLFSQDLGEDSVFNNKVGVDCIAFPISSNSVFVFKAELLFVLFLCVFLPSLVLRPDKAVM